MPHTQLFALSLSLELTHCTLSRQPTGYTFGLCRLSAGMFWDCSAAQCVAAADRADSVCWRLVLSLGGVCCGCFLLAGRAAVFAGALGAWPTHFQRESLICIC